MSAINLMLWRDLRSLAMQALTIALVIAAGVAAFIAPASTHSSLLQAREAYYDQSRFAHLFVRLHRAPLSIADRLRDIEGVAAVHPGLGFPARLTLPGVSDLIAAQLQDLPADDMVNALTLKAGFWPEAGSPQILVSEAFATRRAIRPGDTVQAVINGKTQTLGISGIASSPEYLIGVGEAGMADDRSFAILWMDRDRLAAAFDMRAAFNRLAVRVIRDADIPRLQRSLDSALREYGSRGSITRAEQPSNRALSQEINEQRVFAIVLPAVFLAIAVFILNVVLTRLIGTQRDRIATLKAIGYPSWRIAAHYLSVAMLIALAGGLIGLWVGNLLGIWMTRLFIDIFRIPGSAHRLDGQVVAVPVTIALAAALAAAALAVQEVLRLSAAEAMRPPSPASYRHTLSPERSALLHVPAAARMVVRGITRRPVRAALTVLGMAGAIAILVAGTWWRDAFDRMLALHFDVAMPADVHLGFATALPIRVTQELARLPGVLQVEARRSAAVRLSSRQISERLTLETLQVDSGLRRPINAEGMPVAPPPAGLMLSARVARKLRLAPGDPVQIEFLDGKQREQTLTVGGIFDEPMGRSAFIDDEALQRAQAEPASVSLVALRIARAEEGALIAALRNLPSVTGAFVRHALVDHIRANTQRNLLVFTGVLSVFAAAIAAGVVYNSARIALAERRWELASLRVIGMRESEVSRLMLGELALQTLLAIPVGCVAGWWLAKLLVSMMSSENFTIPLVILPRTYAWAVGVMVLTAVASAMTVRHRLQHLDLIEVLKTRE